MRRSILFYPAVLGILIGAPACDNVEWDGLEVHLQPPPPQEVEAADRPGSGQDEEEVLEPLAEGPLLYVVEAGVEEASLLPVAERTGEGLVPLADPEDPERFARRFQADRFEPGEEFLLLSGGHRAGTFVAGDRVAPDSTYCAVRPRGAGTVEVVPGAQGHDRFLAIRKADARAVPHGPLAVPDVDDALRAVAVQLAQSFIAEAEAPWPPSVEGILHSLRTLPAPDEEEPLVAATFVFGDELDAGTPDPNAYSLFFLARRDAGGDFSRVHSWYQRHDAHGKGWPSAVDVLPDRRGGTPLLVEVFGEEARWFLSLEETGDGSWAMVFQDPCAEAEPPS